MKVELGGGELEGGGGEGEVEEEEDNIDVARSPSFGDDKRISSLEEVLSNGLGFQFSFPVLVDVVDKSVTAPEPGPGNYLDESVRELPLSGPGSTSSSDVDEDEAVTTVGSTTGGSAKESFARSGSEPAIGSSSKWGKFRSLMIGRSHSERKNKNRSRIQNQNPNDCNPNYPKKKKLENKKKKEKEKKRKRKE